MSPSSSNIVVSGGTGSGKTTLLNVLSSFIPEDERIVTIEDAAEIQLTQRHVVSLETTPPVPGTSDVGRLVIRDLVKGALRMRPDRIVVGAEDEQAIHLMRALYAPFQRNHERLIVTDIKSAELTKYAANAMLATKISFINEIAGLAERLGADVEAVRRGIGSDPRIGYHFIYPGVGYGGSCFPKDVKALIHTAQSVGFAPEVLLAVERRNQAQRQLLGERIARHYGGSLAGKTVAVWGLAFKPETDDMREAPSRELLAQLWAAGARVRAHDPVAMEEARRIFGERADLALCETPMQALQVVPGGPDWFHPGRSGTIQIGPQNILGHFGELHPRALAALDAEGPLVAFEVILERIPEPKAKPTRAKPALDLSPFQPVSRDFAFIVDKAVAAGDMVKTAQGADRALIANVGVFDLYEGAGVEAGKKSVALAVTLQPTEKTLTEAEIEAVGSKIVAEIGKRYGATLRG